MREEISWKKDIKMYIIKTHLRGYRQRASNECSEIWEPTLLLFRMS